MTNDETRGPIYSALGLRASFVIRASSFVIDRRAAVDRSLWMLMGLRLWGWLRYLARNVRTVKGALLAGVGGLLLFAWLGSVLLAPRTAGFDPDLVRRYGPLALAAYCLLVLFTPTAERAIAFSPAEVDFLFAG